MDKPGAIADYKGVVEIETPYYTSKTDATAGKGSGKNGTSGERAQWVEIPFMGKSLAGMTLMPYGKSVKGASISYQFKMTNGAKRVRIHVITKSTLDYLNKGGLTYGVSVDNGAVTTINLNGNLNEKPENIYSIYYPTVARRVIDKVVEADLPDTADGIHTLTLTPDDPAIVFEKIVVDGRPERP